MTIMLDTMILVYAVRRTVSARSAETAARAQQCAHEEACRGANRGDARGVVMANSWLKRWAHRAAQPWRAMRQGLA